MFVFRMLCGDVYCGIREKREELYFCPDHNNAICRICVYGCLSVIDYNFLYLRAIT